MDSFISCSRSNSDKTKPYKEGLYNTVDNWYSIPKSVIIEVPDPPVPERRGALGFLLSERLIKNENKQAWEEDPLNLSLQIGS